MTNLYPSNPANHTYIIITRRHSLHNTIPIFEILNRRRGCSFYLRFYLN